MVIDRARTFQLQTTKPEKKTTCMGITWYRVYKEWKKIPNILWITVLDLRCWWLFFYNFGKPILRCTFYFRFTMESWLTIYHYTRNENIYIYRRFLLENQLIDNKKQTSNVIRFFLLIIENSFWTWYTF